MWSSLLCRIGCVSRLIWARISLKRLLHRMHSFGAPLSGCASGLGWS